MSPVGRPRPQCPSPAGNPSPPASSLRSSMSADGTGHSVSPGPGALPSGTRSFSVCWSLVSFLHQPAWVRARPGHRLLACSVVAGVSPGGECILAWAAAAWPPSWYGQRLPLQRGLGFPSGCLAWNVCGNLHPWEEVHHVGACSVVGALTFGLDVAAVAAPQCGQRRDPDRSTWETGACPWPQPLPHADDHAGSSYSAEAVVLERDGNKHGESKCGAFNVPTCPDARLRTDGARHIRPP